MTSIPEKEIIQNTMNFVREELKNAEGGHDWFHIERVYKNALLILKDEKADFLLVSLGALLHDIADYKFNSGNEEIGPQKAENFLKTQQVSQEIIDQVIKIIANVSYKGGNFERKWTSPELEIIQDADRLDAMGAIGIARTFNYGGFKNRKIYDPEISPDLEMSPEEYKKSNAPTLNHFYEKLLRLKEDMNTSTGKKIAQKRHEFMEEFLAQFYAEWEGRA